MVGGLAGNLNLKALRLWERHGGSPGGLYFKLNSSWRAAPGRGSLDQNRTARAAPSSRPDPKLNEDSDAWTLSCLGSNGTGP